MKVKILEETFFLIHTLEKRRSITLEYSVKSRLTTTQYNQFYVATKICFSEAIYV